MNRYCNDAGWLRPSGTEAGNESARPEFGPRSGVATKAAANSLARDLWRLEDAVVDQCPSLLNVGAPC